MNGKSHHGQPAHAYLPAIGFRRVSRFYKPEKAALFDVSFDVLPGEFVYISGSSGAGKSTALRLMYGAEGPDTGAVLFGGHDLRNLHPTAVALLRRRLGVVFQDYRLVPELTAAQNIALPLEVDGVRHAEISVRVEEMLEAVGLPGIGKELASSLSGGEQQRVAIARALVRHPEILLADEPTGNLDVYNANFVLDLLEEKAAAGTTVVLATHDRMLMAARPHRVMAFERGRLLGANHSQAEAIAAPCVPRAG
ncbi:MAG: ATP-binding cassette domain-containing protein [Myxococcota bacterium]|jgi:cell division transport system ATP-binding protein|nr:ATP-binding cassette domain-containing protein [Myxococcota bacterium]